MQFCYNTSKQAFPKFVISYLYLLLRVCFFGPVLLLFPQLKIQEVSFKKFPINLLHFVVWWNTIQVLLGSVSPGLQSKQTPNKRIFLALKKKTPVANEIDFLWLYKVFSQFLKSA